MVNQKKNPMKAKQQTPNKPKNKKNDDLVDYDMDSDGSGSDEQVVKKTPGGKTPKGKQQNDKRVSFQIPGKNTPANKTPKGENALAKKQLTPGKKTNLKEFPGIMTKNSDKKNGTPKKPADDDDDDDDEDDDDDDDDEDEDADLDMLLGGDDDDDDDDDEDEEDDDDDEDEDDDDDDDEDDDDEEPPQLQQKKKQDEKKKQNAAAVQKQTPPKSNKDAKNVEKQTPKQVKNQSPSKAETATPVVKKALQIEADRRRERDNRTLFVGNLPADITAQELKALSVDIISVNIPKMSTKSKRKSIFAFLEFVNEEKTEDNYKSLQSKKLRNQPIKVDFTGVKRQNFAKDSNESVEDKPINLKKLYVASLPDDVTMDKLAPFFPKSHQVTINTMYGGHKTAAVVYKEEKDAADDLEASKNAILKGKPITVLYSVAKDRSKKRKRSKAKQPAAKKVKVEIKEESDDDDDDDDDDDEDDE